jgi:hypothetical protein
MHLAGASEAEGMWAPFGRTIPLGNRLVEAVSRHFGRYWSQKPHFGGQKRAFGRKVASTLLIRHIPGACVPDLCQEVAGNCRKLPVTGLESDGVGGSVPSHVTKQARLTCSVGTVANCGQFEAQMVGNLTQVLQIVDNAPNP